MQVEINDINFCYQPSESVQHEFVVSIQIQVSTDIDDRLFDIELTMLVLHFITRQLETLHDVMSPIVAVGMHLGDITPRQSINATFYILQAIEPSRMLFEWNTIDWSRGSVTK